jgi:hypothetical protein
MPRKARRRRSSPDAEEFDSDREVSPSGHRRRRLNVRSPSNSAANEEPSVSLNYILSLIRNGQEEIGNGRAEVRLQIEQSQEEIRNGHCQFEDFQEEIRSCQAEICQWLEERFETVVRSEKLLYTHG